MTKKDNLQTKRRTPLRAGLRLFTAILLLAGMFGYGASAVETTGYDFQDGLNDFLLAFLPAISILLLIPVVIRGSFGEKIIAAVFLLPAAWFGFVGWQNVIYYFIDYPFGR
jgi:hypothetical protein